MAVAGAHLDEEFTRLVMEPVADPRPIYAELRERAPVFRTPFGFWYVTRYDLAVSVVRNDPAWSASAATSSAAAGAHHDGFAFDVMRRMMLTLDSADHARLRRLVSPIFVPRAVERLRAKVDASVAEQLDALGGRDEVDLFRDLALIHNSDPTRQRCIS
jgi:cytochrome P450 enzyme